MDLCNAYFHVPIVPEYQCFLRFALQGQALQVNVLCSGLSLVLWVFSKSMQTTWSPKMARGISILADTSNILSHITTHGPQLAPPSTEHCSEFTKSDTPCLWCQYGYFYLGRKPWWLPPSADKLFQMERKDFACVCGSDALPGSQTTNVSSGTGRQHQAHVESMQHIIAPWLASLRGLINALQSFWERYSASIHHEAQPGISPLC